jgi:thiamine pyrophosphokinase
VTDHTVIVVAGGDPVDPIALDGLPADALVIAADSGIDVAHALGLRVGLAVGDFDSVTDGALAELEAEGVPIERHPAAKDLTDLALALDAAVVRGAERIIVLGGHGGRLDHLLANALLLASPQYRDVEISARMGTATITVVRRAATLVGDAGDLVSLVAMHGVATGVRTTGLLFALDGEDLHPGSTRGISNQLVGRSARIEVDDGTLLAVQPGTKGAIRDL